VKLPNAQFAVASERKVRGYLLAFDHPYGRHKALLFSRLGFSEQDWRSLSHALLCHAASREVSEIKASPYGTRYILDGPLETPSGIVIEMRTVWFIETDNDIPRLVTAYPVR
jgi:hypothetical protein